MRRWMAWFAILQLASVVGCEEKSRPPLAQDAPPAPEEPGSLVDPDETPTPSTISPCGAATIALDFVRPNLYFAIDASGSMTEAIPRGEATYAPGTAPVNRFAALSRAIEALLRRVGHRVNYGASLFPPDDATCGGGEEIRELAPGDDVSYAVSGDEGPLLGTFMFHIKRRVLGGGTPVAAALRGLLPALRAAGPNTYVFLVTDGGPNCNPQTSCGIDTCIPNLERARLSSTEVCDDSINCCDGNYFGPENCLDQRASVEAVRALADAGVNTFVVGIPGSEAFAATLDQLALAGGVPRTESPYYYRVGDADALLSTVNALGVTVAMSCDIQLTEPPPDPDLVNLFFDGELIPADPVDGWAFSSSTSVQVRGAACALLEAGEVLRADVIAGCPIVIQ